MLKPKIEKEDSCQGVSWPSKERSASFSLTGAPLLRKRKGKGAPKEKALLSNLRPAIIQPSADNFSFNQGSVWHSIKERKPDHEILDYE